MMWEKMVRAKVDVTVYDIFANAVEVPAGTVATARYLWTKDFAESGVQSRPPVLVEVPRGGRGPGGEPTETYEIMALGYGSRECSREAMLTEWEVVT